MDAPRAVEYHGAAMNTVTPPAPPAPDLPAQLRIEPVRGPVDFEIAVPGSKSITNRALVLGALAQSPIVLTGALFADDTHYMMEALKTLGFSVSADPAALEIRIAGRGGEIPAREANLFVGNAGTVMRFLTSFVCLGHGAYRMDGTERMRQRPIDDLIEGLHGLGVKAQIEGQGGCPPVRIEADGLPGGRVQVSGSKSSQYVSGLLMVAPYAKAPLEVEVVGEFVSQPYVELTLRTMADLGVGTTSDGNRLYIPTHGARYRGGTYAIEGDASAASYWLAAAAILGGRAVVTNVRGDSPQGDAAFAKVLERMGCRVRTGFLAGDYGIEVARDPAVPLKAVHVDLNAMPDVAQTLAAVALFADGTTSMINIANLRIKETDRLSAVAAELTRLGAKVEEGSDFIEITPGPAREAVIQTYDDHRMAMAFSLVGLGRPGVTIDHPACVAKTYPHYFKDLERLRR